jgi:hypothetical protein
VLPRRHPHWNRLGAIQIKSADRVITTIPATNTFNDTYTFTGCNPKAPNPCASDLSATQDNTPRTIGLGSDPGERVLFADGITLADGTTPAAGDVLCQGWNLGVHHTGHWSLVTDVTGGGGGARANPTAHLLRGQAIGPSALLRIEIATAATSVRAVAPRPTEPRVASIEPGASVC